MNEGNRKILVLGASGLIGRRIAERLLAIDGWNLIVKSLLAGAV